MGVIASVLMDSRNPRSYFACLPSRGARADVEGPVVSAHGTPLDQKLFLAYL